MKCSRRAFIRFALVASAGSGSAALLAACGEAQKVAVATAAPTAAAPAAATAAPATAAVTAAAAVPQLRQVKLRWGDDWVAGKRKEAVEKAVVLFRKQFPNVDVEQDPTFGEKLALEMQQKRAPNIFRIGSNRPVEFKGLLMDLRPLIQKWGTDISTWYQPEDGMNTWNPLTQGGYWGVHVENHNTVTYLNLTLLDKAGVKVPAAWNWDEFREAAKKATPGDNSSWGVWSNASHNFWWYPLCRSAGTKAMWDFPKYTKVTWDEGDGFQGYKFAVDLIHKDKVSPTVSAAKSAATADVANIFLLGKIALQGSGPQAIGNTIAAVGDKFKFGVGPIPAYPKTNKIMPTANGTATGMPIFNEYVDEGFAWIQFQGGPVYGDLLAELGLMPSNKVSMAKYAKLVPGLEVVQKHFDEITQKEGYLTYARTSKCFSPSYGAMAQVWGLAFEGEKTPEQGWESMINEGQKALDKCNQTS
ncbi:MAG: hypothetical protein FJ029_06370 [Actinobacteria bacterium]|nr:hypothetical protein [Actinomycetota bacterium]